MYRDETKNAILLVEDSEEDVFFFNRAFAKSGVSAELLLATDGKAAISLLGDQDTRSKIALVFLDLKLPLLSGFDVLRWIRAQNFVPLLRTVILSGAAYETDKVLANQLGAEGYFVKPITPESIQKQFAALRV